MRRALLAAIVLLATVGLIACGGDGGGREPPGVAFRLDPALIQGDTLTISGTGKLPDGSVLTYSVSTEPDKVVLAEGDTTMSGEVYQTAVDASGWPDGTIIVYVEFAPAAPGQPAVVTDTFGRDGSLLTGVNVSQDDAGNSYIRLSTEVERPTPTPTP